MADRAVIEVSVSRLAVEVVRASVRSRGFWLGFMIGPWVTIAVMQGVRCALA